MLRDGREFTYVTPTPVTAINHVRAARRYTKNWMVRTTSTSKPLRATRRPGLQDEWDAMVVVTPGMKAEKLNELANTPGMCWQNLPGPYNDKPTTAYYLFLRGGNPLRAATWWFPTDDELDFRWTSTKVVYPDTVLTPLHSPGADPKLRVAPAN